MDGQLLSRPLYGCCCRCCSLKVKPGVLVDGGLVAASEGSSAGLICNADPLDTNKVDWTFRSTGDVAPTRLVSQGDVLAEFTDRFELRSGLWGDGVYRLTIRNLSLNDSGLYACNEGGVGGRH